MNDAAYPKPENVSDKNWLIFVTAGNASELDLGHPHDVSLKEVHRLRGGADRNRYAPNPSDVGDGKPVLRDPFADEGPPPPGAWSPRRATERPSIDYPGGSDRRGSPVPSPSAEAIPWKPFVEPNDEDRGRFEAEASRERRPTEGYDQGPAVPPDPWSPSQSKSSAFQREVEGAPQPPPSFSGAGPLARLSLESPAPISRGTPGRSGERRDEASFVDSPGRSRRGASERRSNSPAATPGFSGRHENGRTDREFGTSPGGRLPSRTDREFGNSPGRAEKERIDRDFGSSSGGRPFESEFARGREGDPGGEGDGFFGDRSDREFRNSPGRNASPRNDGFSPRREGNVDQDLPRGVRRYEEDRQERFLKKELLAELAELCLKPGFAATETYTIDSDIHDIRWEVNRLNDLRYRLNKTRVWRHRISRCVKLAEHLDREYGPKIHIGGISEDVEKELGGWDAVLDDPLDRIFKRSRRGESNPYYEIAGALAAPVALRFVTNYFLKGRKNDLLYQTVLGDRRKDVSGPEPPPNRSDSKESHGGPNREFDLSPNKTRGSHGDAQSNATQRASPRTEKRIPTDSPGASRTNPAVSPRTWGAANSPNQSGNAENEATATAWSNFQSREASFAPPAVPNALRRRPKVPLA